MGVTAQVRRIWVIADPKFEDARSTQQRLVVDVVASDSVRVAQVDGRYFQLRPGANGNGIELTLTTQLSDEQASSLVPDEAQRVVDISSIKSELELLENAADRFSRLLKSEFFQLKDGRILLIQGTRVSLDGEEWLVCPATLEARLAPRYYEHRFEFEDVDHLAELFSREEHGFIGWQLLIHAREHRDPRVGWILAVTAAELAIKEALVRIEPSIERLLLETPSPPIAKLYGRLLEHYAGRRSGFVNALRVGAERRNQLIHSPSAPPPSREEWESFLRDCGRAIFELVVITRTSQSLPLSSILSKYKNEMEND